jgi:hypothetical protein
VVLAGPRRRAVDAVDELATTESETDAWISPDGHTIFFTRIVDGQLDVFTAIR